MASEKSLAIVLRVIDFSESSVIATVFTRDFGKIGALAKGARRPKSSFEAALDLLAVCRIVFIHKSTGALDLLTEAKLERRFRSSARDLSRLYAGYYLAELLHDLTEIGDPHPELFELSLQALLSLDTEGDLAATVLRFEVGLLQLLGHLPSLADCVVCGKVVPRTGRVPFSQLEGGVLCQQCRPGKRQVMNVSAGVMQALQQASESTFSPEPQFAIEPSIQGELRAVVNRYISNLLGRRPKLQAYLRV